jgi:predicted transposase/invertase (TIGR01784 family)
MERHEVMDYNKVEDGGYLHFEFQTTKKKEDITRFLYYDTSLFCRDNRKIETIVVYSSEITNAVTHIDAGTVKYNIRAFYMYNLDGDENYIYLKNKINNGEHLTNEDIMKLTFIPLMRTDKDKGDITIDCIELANIIPNSEEKTKSLTLLYALFDKFGDEKAKSKFKETVSMTEVGKMIFDEGKEEGKQEGLIKGKIEGKTEGKLELLVKQLSRKFKGLPKDLIENIKKLPDDTLDIIAMDIFTIESIDELREYIK